MSRPSAPYAVRPYQTSDERGWLRCRVLSFLGTQYYDDVKPHRTVLADPSIALVAVSPDDEVIGILDVEIDGRAATIDTIAAHPDHQGVGIASALLSAAITYLQANRIVTLDAWMPGCLDARRRRSEPLGPAQRFRRAVPVPPRVPERR